MPIDDTYDDIVAAAMGGPPKLQPHRTKKGALKFQPESDWSLDRLSEVENEYQKSTGRRLPVSVRGQGRIHDRWNYEHSDSADIGLNPNSREGKALIAQLQKQNVPFLAFDRAIPGVSTGEHIHIGRPSKRKGASQQDPYDDIINAAVQRPTTQPAQESDYDDVIAAATAKSVRQTPTREPGVVGTPPGGAAGMAAYDRNVAAQRQEQIRPIVSPLSRQAIPDVGQMMTEARATPEAQAGFERRERARKEISSVTRRRPSEVEIQGHVVGEKAQEDLRKEAEAERERLVAQFTPEDKDQVLRVANQLRRHGPGAGRGIDKAIQGAVSSALYQLAGLTGAADLWQGPNALGDNLRRKALAGELSVEEVADLPQPQREKVAEFLTGMVAGLPALTAATTLGGPVAGFAALHGTEALGRNLPAQEVATETAKGATLGKVFKQAGNIKNVPKELAAIGAGTAATEAAFGASPEEALQAAGGNILFAGGMKAIGGRRGRKAETPIADIRDQQTPRDVAQGQRNLATEGNVAEGGQRSAAPQKFQHLEFGEVKVTASQEGARRGRIRVAEVADPEKIHYVKKADQQGRGNSRLLPIKETPAEVVIPSVVEEARQRISKRSMAPKEPWQETKVEYRGTLAKEYADELATLSKTRKDRSRAVVLEQQRADILRGGEEQSHRYHIEKALREGKSVPPEVLKNYPDLVPQGRGEAPTDLPATPDVAQSTVVRPSGWDAQNDVPATWKKEGHIYRGMEQAEFDATVGAGKGIKSKGEFSHPTEGTVLTDDPSIAEGYVNFGRSDPRKTGQPTYLVESSAKDKTQLSPEGYFKTQSELPPDSITRVWKFDAAPDGSIVASEITRSRAEVPQRGLRAPALPATPVSAERPASELPVEAAQLRAETTASTPVPVGMVRLYRGQGTQEPGSGSRNKSDAGRWFTTGRSLAEDYAEAARLGEKAEPLRYVDVPVAEAEAMLRRGSTANPEFNEYVLNDRYLAQVKPEGVPVQTLSPAKITPEQRATEYAQAERDVAALPSGRRLNPRDAGEVWTPERRERAKAEAIARVSEGAAPIELRQRAVESAPMIEPEVKSLLERYEEKGDLTIGDLVKHIEGATENPRIMAAVEKYRQEEAYDRSLKGRGDMDAAEDAFLNEVRSASEGKEVIQQPSKPVRKERPNAVEKALAPEKIEADTSTRRAGETRGSPAPSFVTSAIERQAKRAAHKAEGGEYRGSGGPDTQAMIDNVIVKGWDLYSQKVKPTFEEWSRKLREELGPESESHLKKVWAQLGGPETSTTSARKAQMAADRAELDLPELPPAERKGWQESRDNAIDKGLVERATILADEVLDRPRGLNDEQTAGLVLRAQMLKNRLALVRAEMVRANTPDAVQAKAAEAQALQNEFNKLSAATKASGSQNGRNLVAHKLTINQDFDLTSLIQRATEAKERPLTPKEHARYEDIVKERDKAVAERDKALEQLHVKRLQQEIDKASRVRTREAKKESLDKEAAMIKQNIAAEFARLKFERGQFLSQGGLGSLDPNGVITKNLLNYARNRVEANIGLKAEALIDDAFSLVKDFGVTRRQVAEALSGYGKVAADKRSEAAKNLAAIRSEIASLLKAEDIVTGARSSRQEGPRLREGRGPRAGPQMGPREGPRLGDVRRVPAEGPQLTDAPLVGPKLSDVRRVREQGPQLTDAPKQGPELSDVRRVRAEGPRMEDAPVQGPQLSDARRLPAEGPRLAESTERVAGPKYDLVRNANRLKELQRQEAEWERRLNAREFESRPRKEPYPYNSEVRKADDRVRIAEAKFHREMERERPGHQLRNASGVMKAWLLSGPPTQAMNLAGTGTYQVFREVARLPAAIADGVWSGARQIAGLPAQRSITGPSPSAMLDSVVQAGTVGRREFMEIMRHGATKEMMERHQYQEIDFGVNTGKKAIDSGVKLVELAHNAVFRFMSGSDRVFYQGAYKRNLIDRATVQARNEGVFNVRERAKELTGNPTEQLEADARHDALVSTFNNNNWLSTKIKRARSAVIDKQGLMSRKGAERLNAAENLALDFILPFDRTPTNVVSRVVEASPAGYVKNAGQLVAAAMRGSMPVEHQRQMMQTFGNATAGTALMGFGWYLADVAKGLITTDEYNVYLNIPGLPKINLRIASPVGNVLALGARLRIAHDKEGSTWGDYAKPVIREPLNIPVLRATSPITEIARDPERSLPKNAARIASMAVPFGGAVRFVGKVTDSKERKATGFKENIQKGIPGWRNQLPENTRLSRDEAKEALKARIRRGMGADVESAVQEGKITRSDQRSIDKYGAMTPAQERFDKQRPATSLDRFERMDAKQREEVLSLMERKAYTLLNSEALTDVEKEKFRERIETLGITPSKPGRSGFGSTGSSFRSRFSQGARP